MRRRNRRILILAAIGLVIVFSISLYVLLVPLPASSYQTNVRKGYTASYTYVTSYAGLSYVNKFSVTVTRISGNTINFEYQQTEATNATTYMTPTNNYSLALDPNNPSTFESGSALPLFVANYLKPGNGTSEIPASGTEPAVPINYSISIGGGLTRVQFTVGSQRSKTIVNWNLDYNETTGLLISGFSSLTSSLVSPSSFRYTMTSFTE